jgi:methylphosphotriester-DNA--protein-cysteine methyltransferase
MASSVATIRDSLVTLLCGGTNRCDPSWDKSADAIDQCYKLYFVRDGEAHLALNGEADVVLRAGQAYFHEKFSRTFQMTPLAYMLQKRLNLAKQLLLSTDLTLEKIALRSGFQSPFYLSRMFKNRYNVRPSEFRRRAGP